MELNKNFADLAVDALASYAAEVRTAFDTLAALDPSALTDEQIAEAEALAAHLDEIKALQDERVAAEAQRAERVAALKNRFAAEEGAEEEKEEETKEEETEEAAAEEQVVAEAEKVVETAAKSGVATLAARTPRPAKPARQVNPISITAAADVPQFSNGQELPDLNEVGKALVNRMRGFGTPSGDGQTENLQHFGVANFRLDFPEDLTIDRGTDDMEVLTRAAQETRLPNGSLTAAGGWCAPSETVYDLCAGETTEGILSVPEVNVVRGGIKHTSGPDFATIYANVGFLQTEAQAIAGTSKACYEVPCPAFVDTRLDAIGLCIKAPILTNAAYPELVSRWLSGSMIAHQHKVNASVISRMVTYAGAARVFAGNGGVTSDTVEALEMVIIQSRQKYRLSFSHTLEVVLPYWVRGALRADLGRRSARVDAAVTDAELSAHFSAIGANVQFVYDWQDLDTTAEAYPANFNALVYPSGTFVKGTSDVINLNAVYDAASLAVNTYTALFFEQGLLVAQMCYNADLITVPICAAGRTGAQNLTCA